MDTIDGGGYYDLMVNGIRRSVSAANIARFWFEYCSNPVEMDEVLPDVLAFVVVISTMKETTVKDVHELVCRYLVVTRYDTVVVQLSNGYRIHMPYVSLSRRLLRRICRELEDKGHDVRMPQPLTLYNQTSMTLLTIIDDSGQLLTLDTSFDPSLHRHANQLNSVLSLRDKAYWLPLFLSVHYNPSEPTYKPICEHVRSLNVINARDGTTLTVDEEDLETLLSLVSDTRRRNSYLDIGKALHSYYRGGDRGLRLWLSYVDPSLRDKCTLLYRYKFNVNPITVKTIAWFVLSDDIERYKQWHTRWFDEAFQLSIRQPTGSNVAATMYRYYWLHLLTDANGRWWYFNGTRWINDDTKVRHLIYYDFQRLYTEHRRQVERSNVINKREQIKNIDDILVMLNRYNTNVIKYLADMLYDPNFNVYCDAIPSVIGLVDDVIEVSKTGVIVRKGKPEDYIVRSTGVRWDYNMTWEHPLVQDCLTWFRQLFPDPEETELREYFLRVMASILRAGNKEKALYIMYGKKDGAKSTVKRLLELTLGEYSHTFSTASFMGKSSNGPSPDMALAKGTLVDFIQEPDETDQLRNGLIKMLTGNDSYFGRMLYQNGGRIQPTFKLFLMCNKIPIIPSSDEALKERLVIIPFTSRWTHDAPKDVAEQYRLRRFPIDPDFEDEKLPLLAPAMLWLMVQYYPVYLTKGALVRPEKVTRSIQAYWDDNDLYSHFQRDCIIQDDKYITPIRNVYEHFKSWHTRSLPGHRIPTLIQFKEEMRLRLGFSGNNAWPVKLINDTN